MIKTIQTSPTNIDAEGFRARLAGFEVRDCFLILEPDRNVSLALLARREIKESILDGVVRTGEGVLDIDAGRISSTGDHKRPWQPTTNDRDVYGKQTAFQPTNAEGRFPANLILVHTEGCRQEGTKKVGTGPEGGYTYAENVYRVRGFLPSCKPASASNRGTEEVPNWICQPGCPVAEMDRQSGNRPSTLSHLNLKGPQPHPAKHSKDEIIYQGGWGKDKLENHGQVYGDSGGASRFFKQVQTDTELDDYLDQLIRKR
jgi:hypothetical protein